ncbi:MAG: hypothetical protein GY804_08935 [Alphaproteobacteria bacterium]|nr:hypothetical protein [Alphaproteobacteria bacterium]
MSIIEFLVILLSLVIINRYRLRGKSKNIPAGTDVTQTHTEYICSRCGNTKNFTILECVKKDLIRHHTLDHCGLNDSEIILEKILSIYSEENLNSTCEKVICICELTLIDEITPLGLDIIWRLQQIKQNSSNGSVYRYDS